MPTQNKVLAHRELIARSYCRSILWLDDEIKPHAEDSVGRQEYLTFFHPITEEFHKKGVLCQLKGFPQIEGEDDPYAADSDEIAICQNLAKMADILILDWHLGAKDPKHSSKILNGLIAAGGTRFVIILSQETKLVEQFEGAYGDTFKKSETDWYRSQKGQFVSLLPKSSFKTAGSGEALLSKIYEELAVVYPDYLHWAALEISARIKAYSPQWLANLPYNTDLALLAENIHSAEKIGDAVVENLLEDLKESIDFSSVETVSPGLLAASDWPKAAGFKAQLDADKEAIKANKGLVDQINSLLPLANEAIEALDSRNRKTLKAVLKAGADLESIKLFRQSIDGFGEFSEIKSFVPTESSPTVRGSVFQQIDATDPAEILVCISQSCDCVRAESLLFLSGFQVADLEGKPGETFLKFHDKHYIFRPIAKNISSPDLEETRCPKGFRQAGVLRELAVTRLIARFWNQTTRVGVNQPRFLRESRHEIE